MESLLQVESEVNRSCQVVVLVHQLVMWDLLVDPLLLTWVGDANARKDKTRACMILNRFKRMENLKSDSQKNKKNHDPGYIQKSITESQSHRTLKKSHVIRQ